MSVEYTYYFGSVLQGDLRGEIPFSNVSMSWVLSGEGKLTGEITTADPEARLRGAQGLMPGRTALYVARRGALAWSGILWDLNYTGGGKTKLAAADHWSYFKRRIFNPNVIPASGTINLRDLLDDILLPAFQDDPPTDPQTFSVPANLSYDLTNVNPSRTINFSTFAYTDTKSVADIIEALAGQVPGIDFRMKSYWIADNAPGVQLVIGDSLSRPVADTGASYGYPGTVTDYSLDVSAAEQAPRLYVTGSVAGEETSTTSLIVKDEYDHSNDDVRYDRAISLDDGAVGAGTLSDAADHEYAKRKGLKRVHSLSVRADQEPVFERIQVGDAVDLRIEDPFRPWAGVSQASLRIGELELKPNSETLTITPWSPDGDS